MQTLQAVPNKLSEGEIPGFLPKQHPNPAAPVVQLLAGATGRRQIPHEPNPTGKKTSFKLSFFSTSLCFLGVQAPQSWKKRSEEAMCFHQRGFRGVTDEL